MAFFHSPFCPDRQEVAYQFLGVAQLQSYCLQRLGLSQEDIWAVTVDYFYFNTRSGNTLFAPPGLSLVGDRYRVQIPAQPEALMDLEIRLAYNCNDRLKRSFVTLTVPIWELVFDRQSTPRIVSVTFRAADTAFSVTGEMPWQNIPGAEHTYTSLLT